MIYFRAGWFGLCFTIYFSGESFEIHIEKMNGENTSRSNIAEKECGHCCSWTRIIVFSVFWAKTAKFMIPVSDFIALLKMYSNAIFSSFEDLCLSLQ